MGRHIRSRCSRAFLFMSDCARARLGFHFTRVYECIAFFGPISNASLICKGKGSKTRDAFPPCYLRPRWDHRTSMSSDGRTARMRPKLESLSNSWIRLPHLRPQRILPRSHPKSRQPLSVTTKLILLSLHHRPRLSSGRLVGSVPSASSATASGAHWVHDAQPTGSQASPRDETPAWRGAQSIR